MSLLIVDGSHLSYRAYSTQELQTKSGEGTGAIYGTLRSLADVIGKFKPDRCIVLYDRGRNKKRHKLLESYKKETETDPILLEQKKAKKQEFYRQVNVILDILPNLNIYAVALTDMEADDGAAIAASSLKDVILFSGDKDWIQLINDGVSLYNSGDKYRSLLLTPETWDKYVALAEGEDIVVAKESWKLYRALCGDTSDKIPGISGIGPKTACKMVAGCTTIEELITKLELEGHKKTAKIKESVKDLETFHQVMDLSLSAKDPEMVASFVNQVSQVKPCWNIELFREKCAELEFKSIAETVFVFGNKFRSLRK